MTLADVESASPLTLSVVVTAHAEGRLLRPTVESVTRELLAAGLTHDSEIVIVCDNADALTVKTAEATPSRTIIDVRVIRTSFGEPGGARNAGVAASRGTYVANVDGDDVIAGGFFRTALRMLREASSPLVVHPHLVLSFGERRALWVLDPTSDGRTTHLDLLRFNQWSSAAVSTRRLFEEYPHLTLPASSGYGPEDWVWNIQTVVEGIEHAPAENSVLFYRVREHGGVNQAHRTSILPKIDLAALARALPAAPRATRGRSRIGRLIRAVTRAVYRVARPLARITTRHLSFDERRRLYLRATGMLRRALRRPEPPTAVYDRPEVQEALTTASSIDPAISWAADQVGWAPLWNTKDDGYGAVLAEAVHALDGVEALIAVPWIGVGGADLVALNYVRALQSSRFAGKIAILGTFLEERTHRDLLPEGVPYVHLPESWLELGDTERRRLLAQLIVQVRPEIVISVNCFHITESLADFAAPMTDGTRFFLTLFAFDRLGRLSVPVNPITDDGQRRYLDSVAGVITDNSHTAGLISSILGLEDTVRVHRQPALDHTPDLRRNTAAFTDEATTPLRLLWPHRLDREKRPDTLIAIADRLRARGVSAEIDVYGQRVLAGAGRALEARLKSSGIRYRGPYSGGLPALDTDSYHAMLLTSESEGLPLVIVQAQLLGLPVIATRVGGVPDIIDDGQTGLLTGGPDDVDGFVAAIERLAGDLDLRRRIVENAYRSVVAQHSWDAFARTVERDIVTDPA